jgi:hypothetical protein
MLVKSSRGWSHKFVLSEYNSTCIICGESENEHIKKDQYKPLVKAPYSLSKEVIPKEKITGMKLEAIEAEAEFDSDIEEGPTTSRPLDEFPMRDLLLKL